MLSDHLQLIYKVLLLNHNLRTTGKKIVIITNNDQALNYGFDKYFQNCNDKQISTLLLCSQ